MASIVYFAGTTAKISPSQTTIEQLVYAGDTIVLMCSSSDSISQEHKDIGWFLHGQKLVTDHETEISIQTKDSKRVGVFIKHKATTEDGGSYECRLSRNQYTSIEVRVFEI